MKTFRHLDRAVFKFYTLFVAFSHQRQQLLDRQRPGFGQNHVAGFTVEIFVIFILQDLFTFHLLPDDKILVTPVCYLLCHVVRLLVLRVSSCALRVSGCELRVSGCVLRVTSCVLRVASYRSCVSGCALRVSRFGLRVARLKPDDNLIRKNELK